MHRPPLVEGMGVAMRGDVRICGSLFSYLALEARAGAAHPLRPIREIANTGLSRTVGRSCGALFGAGSAVGATEKSAAGDAVCRRSTRYAPSDNSLEWIERFRSSDTNLTGWVSTAKQFAQPTGLAVLRLSNR